MPKMVKFLIGNKSDLDKERRKVKIPDGKRYADQKGMEFFETSAKIPDGSINDVFANLANHIRKTFKDEELVAAV
jgi:GTPase SAR1 family protein